MKLCMFVYISWICDETVIFSFSFLSYVLISMIDDSGQRRPLKTSVFFAIPLVENV